MPETQIDNSAAMVAPALRQAATDKHLVELWLHGRPKGSLSNYFPELHRAVSRSPRSDGATAARSLRHSRLQTARLASYPAR
jgi:hypothetical protein